jgi:hypothetical protein
MHHDRAATPGASDANGRPATAKTLTAVARFSPAKGMLRPAEDACIGVQDMITLERIPKRRGVRVDGQCYDVCSLQTMIASRDRRVPHSRRALSVVEIRNIKIANCAKL